MASAKKRPATKRFTLPRAQRPPRAVTRDLFLAWRFPRMGTYNPHRMTNPVWQWLARNRELSAYQANAHFGGPSSLAVGPGWCGARFGQSRTELPDGRVVWIAGEHEDHYDPDFFIYNDVHVEHPSGEIELYGYPTERFAPTDFHTATRVDERVVVIGSLGHPHQRAPGMTPVYALDTRTWSMTPHATTGDAPGWIHRHTARLTDDGRAVVVEGGRCLTPVGGVATMVDNHDAWSLDLDALAWTRLTRRAWPQWEIAREDRGALPLFDLQMLRFWRDQDSPFAKKSRDDFAARHGAPPDFAAYDARYTPPFAHERLPDGDEYPLVVSLRVDDVIVRYAEEHDAVRVTVEGALPEEKLSALCEGPRRAVEALARATCVARRLC